MERRSDHQLEIILINGRHMKLMRHELRSFFMSKQLVFSLFAVLGIAMAVDPYVFPQPVNVFARMVFWAMGILLYLGVMAAAGWAVAVLSRRLGLGAVFWPIVGVPVIAITTFGAAYLGALFTDTSQTRLDLDLAAFVRNYLLAQAFEFLLLNFVLPDHLTSQRMKKIRAAEAGKEATSIVANGRTIFVDSILTLEAKQHYVEITTRTGNILVRSTMKTLLAQIPVTAGLQVHRSYWVARCVMVQLTGSSGKRVLLLKDGRSVPVSRPRETQVEKWFREQMRAQKST